MVRVSGVGCRVSGVGVGVGVVGVGGSAQLHHVFGLRRKRALTATRICSRSGTSVRSLAFRWCFSIL